MINRPFGSIMPLLRKSLKPPRMAFAGVLTIAGGTAIGQAVALLFAPVLSRLYSPEDFGSLAVITALIVTLGTVSTLRFDLAVPLPAEEWEARCLALIGIFIALGFSVVGTIGVAFGGSRIAVFLGQENLTIWLFAVPISASTMGVYLVLNQLAIRHRRYGSIARRNVLQSSSTVLLQIAMGAVDARPGGLILGFGIGQMIGAWSLTFGAGLRRGSTALGHAFLHAKTISARYRRFPLLSVPSGLLNALGQQLPILLFASWYGTQVAGWLGLTQRALALPVTLLGTALAQVYLAEIARATRTNLDRARQLFRKSSVALLLIAVFLLLSLVLFGPTAFSLIFGDVWHESGEYSRALSLGLAGQVIGSPLSQTLIVLERQDLQLAWDMLRVALILIVMVTAMSANVSALTSVWLMGTLSATLYGLSWLLSYRTLKNASVTGEVSTVVLDAPAISTRLPIPAKGNQSTR